LLRLFALDLTASDTARLMDLSVRAVNDLYLLLRHRLLAWSPAPAELDGAVELDESYFGTRRVRGKRGRGASGKTIVFGLFKRGRQVSRKSCPTARKRPYRPS
jgi:transposase